MLFSIVAAPIYNPTNSAQGFSFSTWRNLSLQSFFQKPHPVAFFYVSLPSSHQQRRLFALLLICLCKWHISILDKSGF